MRRLRFWGWSAVVLVGIGATAAAAADAKDSGDPPAATSSSSGWDVFGMFGSKDKPAPNPDTAKTKSADADKPLPPSRPDRATLMRQEQATYLRRMAACLKLQEIALQTNDTELQRVAEQLSDRAYALYLQRTGNTDTAPAAPVAAPVQATGPKED